MMADRLNPAIMTHLETKLGKTAAQIRPRISEIRRENSVLTMNAAAQVYAQKQKTSILAKLNQDDRQSLGIYQQAKNITNNVNNNYHNKHIDKSVNVIGEGISNLIIGNGNSSNSQQVGILDDALSDLLDKISISNDLSAQEKSDLAAEIGTIASQSKKSAPDKDTIKKAWSAISVLSKIAGLAASVATVGQTLHQNGLI